MNLQPPKFVGQGFHISVEEAEATARLAKQPSPIVVDVSQATECIGPGVQSDDPLEWRMEEQCNSLEQRGSNVSKSESVQLRFRKRQGPEQSSKGPECLEGQGKSLSSDSPGLGGLTGWAVLEQWSVEDGGASGKEAMAVQDAKPVACQVKTCP